MNVPKPQDGSPIVAAAIGLNGWLWVATLRDKQYECLVLNDDGTFSCPLRQPVQPSRRDAMRMVAHMANKVSAR